MVLWRHEDSNPSLDLVGESERMEQSDTLTESRRKFLANAVRTAGVALAARPLHALAQMAAPIADELDQKRVSKSTWDAALSVLAGNLRNVPGYPRPLLIEGSTYQGIWQECGPHEGLVYAMLARHIPVGRAPVTPVEAALNNHMAFFELQRPDGQLPACVKTDGNGFGQIQMEIGRAHV